MSTVPLRPARPDDLPVVLRLLRAASLPEDVEPHFDNFYVAERDGVVVGAVGLELLGTNALLRSLVVDQNSRRTGLGKSLADQAIAQAKLRSIRKLFLLAIDAASFFERIGFEHLPHAAAPQEVRATREFSELCPSTARLMELDLRDLGSRKCIGRSQAHVQSVERPMTAHRKGRQAMDDLTFKEREFVALGAALGSNCTPCVEHHIGEARKAGLSDAQIMAAVELADKVRKVPATKALNAALGLLGDTTASDANATSCDQVMASKAPGCCN